MYAVGWQKDLWERHGNYFRTREWKYVFVPYGRDELYDLINDPGECVNLAGRSENRPALRDMQDRMARRMEQTRDHALGPLNARRKLTAR